MSIFFILYIIIHSTHFSQGFLKKIAPQICFFNCSPGRAEYDESKIVEKFPEITKLFKRNHLTRKVGENGKTIAHIRCTSPPKTSQSIPAI